MFAQLESLLADALGLSTEDKQRLDSDQADLSDSILRHACATLKKDASVPPFVCRDILISSGEERTWKRRKNSKAKLKDGRLLQIMCVNNNHWILASIPSLSSTSAQGRHCDVYDSGYVKGVPLSYVDELTRLLQPLLPDDDPSHFPLPVRIWQPQAQSDGHSCGLFVAAWLYLLAHNMNPMEFQLDDSQLRW